MSDCNIIFHYDCVCHFGSDSVLIVYPQSLQDSFTKLKKKNEAAKTVKVLAAKFDKPEFDHFSERREPVAKGVL